MARHTQDREDLIREATALVPRIKLKFALEGRDMEIFAGFRKGDALSIYFDSDPVFHFNSQGKLRRAFTDGRILKADQGKLVSWEPQRTESSVTMASRGLSPDEQEQFGERMRERLTHLKNVIAGGQFTLTGQVPEASDGLERLKDWLDLHSEFTVAVLPNVS